MHDRFTFTWITCASTHKIRLHIYMQSQKPNEIVHPYSWSRASFEQWHISALVRNYCRFLTSAQTHIKPLSMNILVHPAIPRNWTQFKNVTVFLIVLNTEHSLRFIFEAFFVVFHLKKRICGAFKKNTKYYDFLKKI